MTKVTYYATILDLNTKLLEALELTRALKADPVDGWPHDLNAWEEVEQAILAIPAKLPNPAA